MFTQGLTIQANDFSPLRRWYVAPGFPRFCGGGDGPFIVCSAGGSRCANAGAIDRADTDDRLTMVEPVTTTVETIGVRWFDYC